MGYYKKQYTDLHEQAARIEKDLHDLYNELDYLETEARSIEHHIARVQEQIRFSEFARKITQDELITAQED